MSGGRARLLGLLLLLLVAAVFLPALRNDFIYFDDPGFVTENSHVAGGFTWENVKWAFLSADIDYWRPLSWLSHMADCQLFGMKPWGHHLTSVLLHAFNSLLLFVVLRKMTGAIWRSLLVAALFGLHPMHVESVAWIAERKDVLSTLFWLLTIWAYAVWVERRTARQAGASFYYGLSLVCFSLGLMGKPMLVTVPCTLLLLDFWPLNRWDHDAQRPGLVQFGFLVVEKLPFFALSFVVGVSTILAQQKVGALKTAGTYPLSGRIANALVAYGDYLGNCVYPWKLSVFYPYSAEQAFGRIALAAVLLAAISFAVCALYRRHSYLLVGWLWYLGTLVPVIGLVQVGEQSMADRYSYVSLIGVFMALVWLAADVTERWRYRSAVLMTASSVILAACIALTCRQLGFWKDSTTLFRHALDVTENNWAAHSYLGYALSKSPDKIPEAIAQFREGLRLAPEVSETHNYLANALAKIPGREAEAIAEFQATLRLNPKLADAHNNLATLLAKTPGRLPEAIAEYREALRLKPNSAEMHYYLGLALAKTPQVSEAIEEFRTALRIKPDSAQIHYDLGHLLATQSSVPEAISEYEIALRLNADFYQAHFNLALLLLNYPERRSEAIEHIKAALRIRPDFEQARAALEDLLPRP